MTGIIALALLSSLGRHDPMVAAMRERLLLAEPVAMSKFNSHTPIQDPSRERAVLLNAVKLAVNMGVDGDLALTVFTAQIEASKTAQRAFLAKWKGHPPFSNVPNLARDIRPKLDGLTPIILEGLHKDRYRSDLALAEGPSDPIYREAWKIATRPLRQVTK